MLFQKIMQYTKQNLFVATILQIIKIFSERINNIVRKTK